MISAAGIYLNYKKIKTLGDLKKYSLEDLYKIRKTPRKVVEEIVEKAKRFKPYYKEKPESDAVQVFRLYSNPFAQSIFLNIFAFGKIAFG